MTKTIAMSWVLFVAAGAGCGDDSSVTDVVGEDGAADVEGGADADADVEATGEVETEGGGDAEGGADGDTDGDADGDADAGSACEALPGPTGRVLNVDPSTVGDINGTIAGAGPGDTIEFADGEYDMSGLYIWVDRPGITLRSASGNRDAVTLDGHYATTEILTIAASDVTIADLTIRRPGTHAIHVVSTADGDTVNALIYNVHVIDPGQQAIKINPGSDGRYVDDGVVACSRLELTDEGRPHVDPTAGGCYTGGIDAHQARGWVIRDNEIEGFWCDTGLSEHAVHFWRGCRDTIVERNELRDNARGVGFGLMTDGEARTYADDPCPAAGGSYVDHYAGIVRNNFIFAGRAELFASPDGFDCGVCLWSACGGRVVHNSIVSTGDNFSSIEWRFATSIGVEIANNIATHPLRERDGASATQAGNLEGASLGLFVGGSVGNLHLDPGAAAAIDQGVTLAAGLCADDIDGELRDATPDIGADEL